MKLGPFTTEIKRTIFFDLTGIKDIDLSGGSTDADLIDTLDLLYPKPKVSDDRSVTGVDLKVEWEMKVDLDESGINGFDANALRVWGEIIIEDLPEGADPDNIDIDLIDYIVPFDTETNGFKIKTDNNGLVSYKRYLERGIKCNRVEVDWKKKTVEIGFDDYDYEN